MWENLEIINLSRQEEQGRIGVRTKLRYYKVFHRISTSSANVKKWMHEPVSLGLLILKLSKILMYHFLFSVLLSKTKIRWENNVAVYRHCIANVWLYT